MTKLSKALVVLCVVVVFFLAGYTWPGDSGSSKNCPALGTNMTGLGGEFILDQYGTCKYWHSLDEFPRCNECHVKITPVHV